MFKILNVSSGMQIQIAWRFTNCKYTGLVKKLEFRNIWYKMIYLYLDI